MVLLPRLWDRDYEAQSNAMLFISIWITSPLNLMRNNVPELRTESRAASSGTDTTTPLGCWSLKDVGLLNFGLPFVIGADGELGYV